MNKQRTVLLLNSSNKKDYLTYPYAFVQVSEIADRFNINVIRKDLFGIGDEILSHFLRAQIKDNTDMVLITLRNTDGLGIDEYQYRSENKNYQLPLYGTQYNSEFKPWYFPIEDTKMLIKKLREITDLPIVVGGYGFSVLPEKLMNHLQPDYGVFGGPDDFFKQFENILIRHDLDKISNLLYWNKDILQIGRKVYFPPAKRIEYTEEILTERQAFVSSYPGQVMDQIAVEIIRGCPYQCNYCSEPLVLGKKLQYRDLEVIEEELEFLGKRGYNLIYMICSEINAGGNEFIMKLADRIIQINEKRDHHAKISWYGLFLMTFLPKELEHLKKSGFLGGWYDAISFDDNNLQVMKIPYKSEEIVQSMVAYQNALEKENKNKKSLEYRIFNGKPNNSWSLFLGNIATTIKTVQKTLKVADEFHINQIFDGCAINKATRIFDHQDPSQDVIKYTKTITDKGLADTYNEIYPSVSYPPTLMKHFADVDAIDEFFTRMQDTFFSNSHLFNKEWNWFLANNINLETFRDWWIQAIKSGIKIESLTEITEVKEFLTFLYEYPSKSNIGLLFNPTPNRKKLLNFATNLAIHFVLFAHETEFTSLMEILGFPSNLENIFSYSPYEVASKLFDHYNDINKLVKAINNDSYSPITVFFVKYLIYLNEIPLRPEYQV
ncbi:MAG: radical SAM protein, partial [Candidatus Kariarchaeaceae archaeon]